MSTVEVARLMLCGAFTSAFELDSYLKISARVRGLWSTIVVCKQGKMQTRFTHASGKVRIIQRSCNLRDFMSFGIVDPGDTEEVLTVAEKVTGDPEEYGNLFYWKKGMKDNISKEDMITIFSRSCRSLGEDRKVCLVDMTVFRDGETDLSWVYDQSHGVDQPQSSFLLEEELTNTIRSAMAPIGIKGVPGPNLSSSFDELQAFSRSMQERGDRIIEQARARMEEANERARELSDVEE